MFNQVQLEKKRGLVSGMVEQLGAGLMEALPDYGEHLGADGKALESHSTGEVDRKTGKRSDGDADWGHHSIRGMDAKRRPWEKVKAGSATVFT